MVADFAGVLRGGFGVAGLGVAAAEGLFVFVFAVCVCAGRGGGADVGVVHGGDGDCLAGLDYGA